MERKERCSQWGDAALPATTDCCCCSCLLCAVPAVYWRFVWAGVRHEVELFHSTVSGKRTVRCDGALVAQEKHFMSVGKQ